MRVSVGYRHQDIYRVPGYSPTTFPRGGPSLAALQELGLHQVVVFCGGQL